MVAHVGAADPCASGVAAMLVAEFSRNDQNFLPTKVSMRLEHLIGGPLHQRHVLILEVMQRHNLQATVAW
jgi:hypothetical protein